MNKDSGMLVPIIDGPDVGCYIRVPVNGNTAQKGGHRYRLNSHRTGWKYVEDTNAKNGAEAEPVTED